MVSDNDTSCLFNVKIRLRKPPLVRGSTAP